MRRKQTKSFIALWLLSALLCNSATAQQTNDHKPVMNAAPAPIVRTVSGFVRGVTEGDVWARPQLSRRDRSLATVDALIAMNRPDQLRSHLALARKNGLTQGELSEVIAQLAFYAGWPSGVAKEVFQAEQVAR
jgi:4-carboxymuconolactone decarboxylase